MTRIVTSVDIERPITDVWNYLTDLHNAKDWSSEVIETEYSGPLQLGATGVDTRKSGKKEVEWEWVVTAYEPPNLLALTYGPPLNAVANFTFENLEADRTRVSCVTDIKPSGWWRLMTPMIAAEGRKADETQFAKVKAILEGTADPEAAG
jgi:uncharacterized protein YndB with AHSA1/START domain